MAKENILVTGGAGFIGSHLVDALVAEGHQVRALDSLVQQVHGESAPPHLNPAAEFLNGDVRDRRLLEQALDGVTVVFHQAAEVGVAQSMYEIERYVDGNTSATGALLQALVQKRGTIRKLVVASSMSIYGEGAYDCSKCGVADVGIRPAAQMQKGRWEVECPKCGSPLRAQATPEEKRITPTSVYAVTKQDQEQLCLIVGRAYGIPTVALRYFNVYGTRQALSNPYTGICAIFSARLLNDKPPIIFEDGRQTRDFVHVKDVVQANLLAMKTSAADDYALNIGTGVATSVLQIAELLGKGLGKLIAPEVPGKYREGDIRHCVADIGKARKLLGYAPRVTLDAGLADLLVWVRSQHAQDRTSEAVASLDERKLIH